jgi:hypothetical protein
VIFSKQKIAACGSSYTGICISLQELPKAAIFAFKGED